MKDSRSLDQSAQEIMRQKAVEALIAGKTQAEVSELFGVSMKAVSNWWRTYRESGMSGLRKKSRRPKSADEGGKLKGWQCASVVRTIISRTPDQLQFGFMLWTRDAVRPEFRANLIAANSNAPFEVDGVTYNHDDSGIYFKTDSSGEVIFFSVNINGEGVRCGGRN